MGTLSPASPQISPSDGEAGPQQDCPASGYFVVAVPQGCPPLGMVLPWQRHPKTLRCQAGAKPGIPTHTPLTPRGCSGSPQQSLCPKALLSAAKSAPRRTREAPKRNEQMCTEDSVLLGGRSLILGDMPACTPGGSEPPAVLGLPCPCPPCFLPRQACLHPPLIPTETVCIPKALQAGWDHPSSGTFPGDAAQTQGVFPSASSLWISLLPPPQKPLQFIPSDAHQLQMHTSLWERD